MILILMYTVNQCHSVDKDLNSELVLVYNCVCRCWHIDYIHGAELSSIESRATVILELVADCSWW